MSCAVRISELHVIHMKINKIFIPAKKPDDWQQFLAEPEKQWKTGFSARSMAYCWQEANGIPNDVMSVLSQIPDFRDIETLIVIPEHQVPLPGGTRPSQNDCWVLARTEKDLVSIAIEGKVSEPFGPSIGEWIQDASDGKKERLSYLCNHLGLDENLPDNIRYQLIHRTASAVIEAKRFNARYAMMAVHSFSQTAEWLDDFKEFAALFDAKADINSIVSVGSKDCIDLYLAWVCGDPQYLER